MEANNLKPNFDFDNINNIDIKNEFQTLVSLYTEKGMFLRKTANQWNKEAENRPVPKMLFSEFWFENEICFLIADTNTGKSILGVQIGDSLSKGKSIRGFKVETTKQVVLYLDFELSDKQFQNRYSKDYKDNYAFDDNFLRLELNPDMDLPQGVDFEDHLIKAIESQIIDTGAKILIIDNLTYLSANNEKAKDAAPLMKKLKELKSKYNLSLLILAHTPKRDLSKPLTRNDLQGSKMLMNFCDSAFAIGESHQDKQVRYLKQIKERNCEKIFDTDNVCICQINKELNFLQFEFLKYGNESEHLRPRSEKDKENIIERVKELSFQKKSQRDISKELGIGLGTVNKYLKM
ncbi:MAG TPA: AAA family ATPase [Flavobacterium sp.]